ncbi:MAG: radical SAM protein [Patescibacteria group bacterium]
MINNIFNKNKEFLSPNILLTNMCNQQCMYCFAKEEMSKSKIKEMSIKNFEKVTFWLRKNKIKTLRLMGGEPTLHHNFDKIIKIALNRFNHILIFTNGVIPEKNKKIILKNIKKISFNFNIDTPGFKTSKKQRKEILNNINQFSKITNVNIGFTLSDINRDYKKILKDFNKKDIQRLGMRFGIAKPVFGEKSFFSQKDYPFLGTKIVELVKYFKKMGIKDTYIDCGLQKSMFTKADILFLNKNSLFNAWGCEGKWSSFDITPDLRIFPCFPYFKNSTTKLDLSKNLIQISKELRKNTVNCT